MRLTIFAISVLAVLGVSSAFCRNWEYQQVDTAGSWSQVEVEVMPGSEICVCYQDTVSGNLVLARKTDVWRCESIGVAPAVPRRLVPNGRGRPALLLNSDPISYSEDTDSGWVTTTLDWGGWNAGLAFDSSNDPTVAWDFTNDYAPSLATAYRQAGTWTEDVIYLGMNEIEYPWYGGRCGFRLGGKSQFGFLWNENLSWTGGSFDDEFLNAGHTGAWSQQLVAGGAWSGSGGLSLTALDSGGFAACCNAYYPPGDTWGFYCGGEKLEVGAASLGLVQSDKQDRLQVVYRLNGLKYAFQSNGWRFEMLPASMDGSSLDFTLDVEGHPLIAFINSMGIFLARGEVVGLDERAGQETPLRIECPTLSRAPVRIRISGATGEPRMRIAVFDPAGRIIRRFHAGRETVWDGDDEHGVPAARGVYYLVSVGTAQARAVRPARFVLVR